MNEQIRELVRKAGGHFSTRNLMSNPSQQVEFVELWDDRIEKFAELIVRECCDIFVELRTRPADLAVLDVKKHFELDS